MPARATKQQQIDALKKANAEYAQLVVNAENEKESLRDIIRGLRGVEFDLRRRLRDMTRERDMYQARGQQAGYIEVPASMIQRPSLLQKLRDAWSSR